MKFLSLRKYTQAAAIIGLSVGAMSGFAADRQSKVIISFKSPPTAADIAAVQRAQGKVKHVYNIIPSVAAEIPTAALRGLAQNPRIDLIEEDVEVHAWDHGTAPAGEYENTWGVSHIGTAYSHNALGVSGKGVKVAVIDSGIDYTHADFWYSVTGQDGSVILQTSYSGGYDFVNKDNDPMDDNAHGTHVAGTVAAALNGSGVVGAAPGVKFYGLKVLGANGSGSFSDVIAALDWCVQNGIHISNNSYGSSRDPGTQVRNAFANSAKAGVLHIASAGNSGTPSGKGDNVGYPAKYDTVVAVAATDQQDRRASFSSTGSAVELAAPGVGVLSTVPGGSYASYNGTSMASPHVAGVAALVWEALAGRDVDGNGVFNKDDVRAYLQRTAVDLGTKGRDSHFGFGLVQAPR
jgi:subtilisin